MPLAAGRHYGTIVVCGGGCYGGYYVRQLARARTAGAIRFERLVVVDRDPGCRVAQLIEAIRVGDDHAIAAHSWSQQRSADPDAIPSIEPGYASLPIEFVASEWAAFFDGWFAAAVASPEIAAADAVVPSPLMPNLLADWVMSVLRDARPDATNDRVPLSSPPSTPWSRSGADTSHYASFATWMCPINCIEPARCPETAGPREWSMPVAVRLAAEAAVVRGAPYHVIALFQTSHRAYGVGMFDVSAAISAHRDVQRAAGTELLRVLVASVSHCHGALAELHSITR